jgi:hypothetical protein
MINRHFLRHYAEMVIAMMLGMLVLGLPAEGLLQLAGTSTSALHTDAPAVVLLGMGVVMTIPMVAWMRYRGHGWAPSSEMAASMMVPTFAIAGLLGAGVVTDFGTLMTLEHLVMFPAMFGVMLLRPEEYSGHHGHAAAA